MSIEINANELISDIIASIESDYVNERYEECLKSACALFINSNIFSQSIDRSRLLNIINMSAKKVLDNAAPMEKNSNLCCSFCGKKPPDIKLGAGPSAFICNECVDTFSIIFKDG